MTAYPSPATPCAETQIPGQSPFSEVAPKHWHSWIWQMQNAAKRAEDFAKWTSLSPEESEALQRSSSLFQIQCTPYALSLLRPQAEDPLRRMILPRSSEFLEGSQVLQDPLAERRHSPVSRVIHRYPDRVLFLVTDVCSTYCRFCTRKHFTGQEQAFLSSREFEEAIAYIASRKGIREVLLSGGDPLTLSNARLAGILSRLREIPHIEILRIGSRMPVVCPMRIDEELIQILSKNFPVFLMTHFNHPRELTSEARKALRSLVQSGVGVFNQSVLLNGVNNAASILQALFRRLLAVGVKPYYLFSCDPSPGTDHLRVGLGEMKSLQRELWGSISGLALPQFSVDLPDGGGKVGMVPDFSLDSSSSDGSRGEYFFQGFDGVPGVYRDPAAPSQRPLDADEYEEEWQILRKNLDSRPGKT